MSRCSEHHLKLNEHGEGKCSVPMWCGGGPAGFCDKPAYGPYIPARAWWNAYQGEWLRGDGKWQGFVPGLACPGHSGPESRAFMDGSAWCAVWPDFINLQESPAGFGDTPEAARNALRGDSNDK